MSHWQTKGFSLILIKRNYFNNKMEDRDWKGYWLPKELVNATDLNWGQKILLLEIDSQDRGEGCNPTNEYLATFLDKSPVQVSKDISLLKKLGYISFTKSDGRSRFLKSNMNTVLKVV